jgi:anti-sigma factor RsiW
MNHTTSANWDDTQLMAWADGQLPPEQAAALEAAIERDADLAMRAALMQPTRAMVREAWDAELANTPVPAALQDAVQTMVAHDRARRAREAAAPPAPRPVIAPSWRAQLTRWFAGFALPGAVAASVMFGAVGYWLGQAAPQAPGSAQLATGAPAPAALAALLDRVPSGDQATLDGAALAMVASFRDQQGRLCRDFSLARQGSAPLEALACRGSDGAWNLAYAALAPVDHGYQPAGPASALESYLAAIGAGQPLDAAAERAALKRE